MIPKNLQKDLPYAEKPKQKEEVNEGPVGKLQGKHSAIVLDPYDSKVSFFF